MKTNRLLKLLAILTITGAISATASITNSKHDLSSTNTGTGIESTDVDEICVFCHTPHGASSSFSAAPIWNKDSTNTPTKYLMYGTTVAGTTIADDTVSDSSKACLSCHDGVSAVNSLINAPGSGLGSDATMVGGKLDADNSMLAANITSIGGYDNSGLATEADLTNDHPISVTYTAGIASLRPTNTALDGAFIVAGSDTNISGILRGGKVECATCHDPHETANGTFLRLSNAGSALCLTCHAK